MGVNIDPLSFRLDEKIMQVFQVVPGNENRLADPGCQGNLRGLGMAVSFRVGGIKQFHGLDVGVPATQHRANPGVQVRRSAVKPKSQGVSIPLYASSLSWPRIAAWSA